MTKNPAKKNAGKAPMRRSPCPISYALDKFGDKWTLLVLRDLIMWKKTTFQELKNSAESIASNILSDRLKKLEQFGMITRETHHRNSR